MREESHLDDMRSAIRGDFERLAERRGEQELMRVVEGEASAAVVEAPAAEPAPLPALSGTVLVEAEPAPEPELDEEQPPERSWFARFFSP